MKTNPLSNTPSGNVDATSITMTCFPVMFPHHHNDLPPDELGLPHYHSKMTNLQLSGVCKQNGRGSRVSSPTKNVSKLLQNVTDDLHQGRLPKFLAIFIRRL